MADEANDVQDISVDDFMSDEQEAPKAAPSTAEEKKPEVAKTEEPAKDNDTSAQSDASVEPVKPEGETDQTEEPLSKADERKTQLNTEIRDLVSQRNALRDEVVKANSEVYQPATEDELKEQGLSPEMAAIEAMKQEREVERFNNQVADAQLTIESESMRVLNDFPMFNPDNKEYNEELSNEAATLLQANLLFDPNTNQVIGSNVSPYQLYKTLARASGISEVKGQLKGQQSTEKMLANADNASSAAPPKKAVDPVIALWESDD